MGILEAFSGLGKLKRRICNYVVFTTDVAANIEWFYKIEIVSELFDC